MGPGCGSPELHPSRCQLILARDTPHDRSMLQLIVLIGRALALAGRGHHELVLGDVALRQQLWAMKRTTARARVRTSDRLFWIVLAESGELAHGGGGRSARDGRAMASRLAPPPMDTTLTRLHGGRPAIEQRVQALVREMAATNPLWGAPRIHGELGELGSTSRSGLSRASCGDRVARRHRRGGYSS